MAEQNYSIDLDLTELKTMVDNLVPYIYEDELYGKVNLPAARLTPGAILLRLRRLRALRGQMNAAQAAQLETIETLHEGTRKEWNVAFNKKLVHEAESRLRDVQTYLNECKDDPRLCASAYTPEALRRTIVAEILSALPSSDVNYARLITNAKLVDNGLRRYVREDSFIWAEALRPAYPQETFWWLYGRPPKSG
jgi:hypothetical protein